MRIRITKAPDSEEFAEFDLRAYRLGDVFDVPPRLATLLILAGNAEPASSDRAEAADIHIHRRPKKKRSQRSKRSG